MKLQTYLDTLAKQFPSSKWDVREGKVFEAAVLDIDPLQVKIVLFTQDFKQFKKGDVTLTLHAGPHLLKMYGTPTINDDGKVTHCSKGMRQFDLAATLLCDEMLALATAIMCVTDLPPDAVEVSFEAPHRPLAPSVERDFDKDVADVEALLGELDT